MEGRRVTRRAPQRNPLYVLFLCLVAAVFILLIVTIVLGAKLNSTNKALEAAQQQIEQLQQRPAPEQGHPHPADFRYSCPRRRSLPDGPIYRKSAG